MMTSSKIFFSSRRPREGSADPSLQETAIPSDLPGRFLLQPAAHADYWALCRFHYRPKHPATFCLIRKITYLAPSPGHPLLAAVATLSFPTLSCHAREKHFNLVGLPDAPRAAWLRDNLRTISRVIVHPRFRGVGLASALIRQLCDECPTPFVEAIAAMAVAHPMFARAGMIPITPTHYIKMTERTQINPNEPMPIPSGAIKNAVFPPNHPLRQLPNEPNSS